MSYEKEISVHINDWGYKIEFKAETANGNIVSLNHLSGVSGLCFVVISGLDYEMWRDCVSGHFTVNNPSGGLFEWTVQGGFFNRRGVFEGKVKVRISGGKFFTLDDLRISVVGIP